MVELTRLLVKEAQNAQLRTLANCLFVVRGHLQRLA